MAATWGNFLMASAPPIARRVDHVLIGADDPGRLFAFFTETLGLPAAWPLKDFGSFVSGGVFAGNANVEVVRFGRPRGPSPTRLLGLSFEPAGLAEALDALAVRRIPHSPPVPFVGEFPDGGEGLLWTNVVLGGLVGEGSRTPSLGRFGGNSRLNAALGRLAGRLMRARWADAALARSFPSTMVFLVRYAFDVGAFWSGLDADLTARRGGPLGLVGLDEVVIGLRDPAGSAPRWQAVFDPTPPAAPGLWRPGGGAAVRLVPGGDRVESLAFRVRSIPEASEFLAARGLLGDGPEGGVTIDRARAEGLDLRLREVGGVLPAGV